MSRAVVPGSDRRPLPNYATAAPLPAETPVNVSVRVRLGAEIPDYDPKVSRDEIEQRLASKPEDIASITRFAQANGLNVDSADAIMHTVKLSGTAGQMSAAFGVELKDGSDTAGAHRQRAGVVTVPAELGSVVTGVFGLDDRNVANANHVVMPKAAAANTSFDAPQVAAAYNFPPGDGTGLHVAVISYGGNPDPNAQSFTAKKLGIPDNPFNKVDVNGGAENPSDPGPTGENILDETIVNSILPKADKTIYIGPNNDAAAIDIVNTAVHDPAHKNTLLSESWALSEGDSTEQTRSAKDEILKEFRAMGGNYFTSSGDAGAPDGKNDGQNHVEYTASSPFAIGVGATQLSVNRDGSYKGETTWNDLPRGGGAGGGGFSVLYPQLDLQAAAGLNLPGRGVPDVSFNGAPGSGFIVPQTQPDGSIREQVVGGTSASSPTALALAGRLEENLGGSGSLGDFQKALYTAPGSVFHDVTKGDIGGGIAAGPGWDAATGVGSVDGKAMLAWLQSQRTAVTA